MATSYNAETWSSADLVSEVRLEARIPDSELTDAEIMGLASECIWTDLAEILAGDQGFGGFGVALHDVLGSALDGENSDSFWLPESSADAIFSVHWYPSATDLSRFYALSPVPIAQKDDYIFDGTNRPYYYTIEGGRMFLLPKPPSNDGGMLRLRYQTQHPRIVANPNKSLVTAFSSPTFTTSGSTTWPTAPFSVDIVSIHGPHRTYYKALPISSSTTTTITVDTASARAGDLSNIPVNSTAQVMPSGESPYILLPSCYRKPLNLLVSARILRQMGDTNGANERFGDYGRSIESVKNQFSPRIKGQSIKFMNRDSALRVKSHWWTRRRG